MTGNEFDNALEGAQTTCDASASNIGPQRALQVKGSDGRVLRGRDRNPVIRRDVDDEAYQWLRQAYKVEHGTMEGWEQHCRDNGIVTVKAQRREWKHTETLDTEIVDRKTAAHCGDCLRKMTVAERTVA